MYSSYKHYKLMIIGPAVTLMDFCSPIIEHGVGTTLAIPGELIRDVLPNAPTLLSYAPGP